MTDNKFHLFYNGLFFTAFMPYLPYIFPFFPSAFGGFNMTGWAWISMLLITAYILLTDSTEKKFPVIFWIPWGIYIFVYLLFDFSVSGLQLTTQYLLPILIGVGASGFTYNKEKFRWLFKSFIRLSLIIAAAFFFGYFFRGNYTPMGAQTPMLLSITATILAGIYFMTDRKIFLILYGLFFLVPFLGVTRMGIAVYIVIFMLHFSNKKIATKAFSLIVGVLIVIAVFNSESFQKKTFFGGKGSLSDLSLNYYDEGGLVNSSGRRLWYITLEKGLKAAPVFGNGPRSDLLVLGQATGTGHGEAHNDYLGIRYNYGYVGLGLLLFGYAASFLSLYGIVRKEKDVYRVLIAGSALVLFVGLLMFMYSDNILKYTIMFPDIFFALIGMSYAKYES
jgi:hypothetical protein